MKGGETKMNNEDVYLNSSDYKFKLQLNCDKGIEDEILQLVYLNTGMTKNYGRRGNIPKAISNAMGEVLINELRDPDSELSNFIHNESSKEAGFNVRDNTNWNNMPYAAAALSDLCSSSRFTQPNDKDGGKGYGHYIHKDVLLPKIEEYVKDKISYWDF